MPFGIEFERDAERSQYTTAVTTRFLAAFQLIDRLDIDMVSVDLGDVVALAEDTGLTVYDACYLWLARLLKSELPTLDKNSLQR